MAENGTFASTETRYCRLTKMRATDLVLEAIEGLRQSGGYKDGSDLSYGVAAGIPSDK